MKIFLGADHRGFELKESLKPWLESLGHDVIDCGNTVYEKTDDYPDFSFAVADRVVAEAESRGIVICGSAVGVTIAANKVKGARCSPGLGVEEVARGREDDDLNILALSGDYMSEKRAKDMIQAFLSTPFKGDERHTRRLKKIKAREKQWLR
ncbi:RpiB/LacA/LacB family sugar-phosphate isomerase [Candidatus Gottesmanbacteria bacterium]|nr:RpiB/LacA/LacB family sugar-phosphate isomerase [Candidatus Gottesmanbacteria bacterium]